MAVTPSMGTKLQLSISSVFTDIAMVVSVTPPNGERSTTDTTHLASTSREYIVNVKDAGEVSLQIEYDPSGSTHQALFTSYDAGTLEAWKIILTDEGDAAIAFSGYVTKFGFDEIAVDGIVTVSLTIKITGDITITP